MLDLIFFSDSATENTHKIWKISPHLFNSYSINKNGAIDQICTVLYIMDSVVSCMIKEFAKLQSPALFVKRKKKNQRYCSQKKEDPINKKHFIGFLVYRHTLLLLSQW